MSGVLERLADELEQRKEASSDESYVASLYAAGLDKILKKIGEEATETVIAGKGGTDEELVSEMADLWFHSLVLLAHLDFRPEYVLAELDRRFGVSGHAEKASRK